MVEHGLGCSVAQRNVVVSSSSDLRIPSNVACNSYSMEL
jgi:hypothetical protein